MTTTKTSQSSWLISLFKRNWETLALIGVFLGSWVFLYATLGAPTTWDELLYVDLGIYPQPAGEVLNRWFHIYFQKLFLDLAPTPLEGVKLFWGFLIAATIVMVYLAATRIRKESKPSNGLAAALFFASNALLFSYAGNTYADYTVMFFVALAVLVYIAYFRTNWRYRELFLVAFGFLFFVATKSKESGIILAVPMLGFGISQNSFVLKQLFKNLVYVFIGAALGFGLLALLDSIYLHNPLVSVSAERLSEYSAFVFHSPDLRSSLLNRFISIFTGLWQAPSRFGIPWVSRLFTKMPLVSSLYLVTFASLGYGLIKKRNRERFEFFIWILPAAFLALLMLGRVGESDRHSFPMYPVLAILAAQFFDTKESIDLRSSISNFWGALRRTRVTAAALLLAIFAVYRFGPEFQAVYLNFGVAAAEILIILMAVLITNWKPIVSTMAIFLTLVFSFYGIVFDNTYPMASGQQAARGTDRFSPLAAITDDFTCSSDTRFLFSANAVKQYEIFSRTIGFNIYFDCNMGGHQFTYPSDLNLPEDLVGNNLHSFAFITAQEFQELSFGTQSELLNSYSLEYIKDGNLAILSRLSN